MDNFVGFLLPPLVDVVNNHVRASWLKFVLSVLASLVVAVVLNLNKLNWFGAEEVLTSAALVFSESQIAYRLYWSESKPRASMLKMLK